MSAPREPHSTHVVMHEATRPGMMQARCRTCGYRGTWTTPGRARAAAKRHRGATTSRPVAPLPHTPVPSVERHLP